MDEGGARRAGPTRRQVIAAGASALALTAGAGMAAPPALASGLVFEDRNRTGRRGADNRGIAGVLVSNGRDVVRTDAEGRWRLPVADGDSVFVIKPPHWSTPLGVGGVPRFSRLHQPEGTAHDIPWRHAGVAGTGALPAAIDFPLTRQEESARFEALLFADTQPANDTELGYLRDDIVAGALGSKAAFGINHGDVVFDDLSLYPRYLQILGATGIPWHHCPGNHDINSEARDDRGSRETWKRVFGPRHYAFQHAGATFILLDNVHYFGHNPGAARSGTYAGLIGERQLQFVRNLLAHVPREHLVVVSMHIPLATYQDPASAADNTADRDALLRLLSMRPHAVSFAGHMHLTEHHYLTGDASTGSAMAMAPITITCWRRRRAAGGAGRTTAAAFPRPTAPTATRTAITCSRSTARSTRRASCRRPARPPASCARWWTGPRRGGRWRRKPAPVLANSAERRSAPTRWVRAGSWSTYSMAGRERA